MREDLLVENVSTFLIEESFDVTEASVEEIKSEVKESES